MMKKSQIKNTNARIARLRNSGRELDAEKAWYSMVEDEPDEDEPEEWRPEHSIAEIKKMVDEIDHSMRIHAGGGSPPIGQLSATTSGTEPGSTAGAEPARRKTMAKINYKLSRAGQKQSLLRGGDGVRIQKVGVPADVLPDLLDAPGVNVGTDGTTWLDAYCAGSRFEISRGSEGTKVRGHLVGLAATTTLSVRPSDTVRAEAAALDICLPQPRWDSSGLRESIPLWCVRKITGPGIEFDEPASAETVLERYLAACRTHGSNDRDAALAEAHRRNESDLELAADVKEAQVAVDEAARKWIATVLRNREETARQEAEKFAREQARERERDEWIRAHGSKRLRAIVAEDLLDDSLRVYRDERLALDRPGWIWDADWHSGDVEHRDIRNPLLEVIEWLRETRETVADAALKWAHLDREEEYGGDTERVVREPILVAEFLGRGIVLRREEGDNGQG